jgi:hypothetical protein
MTWLECEAARWEAVKSSTPIQIANIVNKDKNQSWDQSSLLPNSSFGKLFSGLDLSFSLVMP